LTRATAAVVCTTRRVLWLVQVSGDEVYEHVEFPHYLAVARALFEAAVDHGAPATSDKDVRVKQLFDASAQCKTSAWWYGASAPASPPCLCAF
jgi:hypothetical protein